MRAVYHASMYAVGRRKAKGSLRFLVAAPSEGAVLYCKTNLIICSPAFDEGRHMANHDDNAIRAGDPLMVPGARQETAIRQGDPPPFGNRATSKPDRSAAYILSGVVQSVGFGVAYLLAIRALMYMNTVWFGLGDYKFGEGGWTFYWPIWSVCYAPIALPAIVIAWIFDLPEPRRAALLWGSLLITLVSLELSFRQDIQLPGLLFQWIALPVAFWTIGRIARPVS